MRKSCDKNQVLNVLDGTCRTRGAPPQNLAEQLKQARANCRQNNQVFQYGQCRPDFRRKQTGGGGDGGGDGGGGGAGGDGGGGTLALTGGDSRGRLAGTDGQPGLVDQGENQEPLGKAAQDELDDVAPMPEDMYVSCLSMMIDQQYRKAQAGEAVMAPPQSKQDVLQWCAVDPDQ